MHRHRYNILRDEQSIIEKKEAPIWWRRAQREKVEEIQIEIVKRELFSQSYEMAIEDIISEYDQKIWLKETKLKKFFKNMIFDKK